MSINLSIRLQTIASFLTPGSYFADIGSDHAYLPSYVCLHNKQSRAVAGEVIEGPYKRSVQTVKKYGLADRIDVRLGNGLDVVYPTDGVEELVIAGMGGSLIKQIIERGKDKLSSIKRIIVQPNTNVDYVRKLLFEFHYVLVNEVILEESNHIYEILVADRKSSNDPYDYSNDIDKQFMFGPILMKEKSSLFLEKWQAEYEKLSEIIQQMERSKEKNESKISLFQKRIQWIEEVIS